MVQTRKRRSARLSSPVQEEDIASDQATPEQTEHVEKTPPVEETGGGGETEEAKVDDPVDDALHVGEVPAEPDVVEQDGDRQKDDEHVLPVMDTTVGTNHAAPSSEEEGAVGEDKEVVPSKGARATRRAEPDDDDDDELVKIEKELDQPRYNGIDTGTKKRLAVILEYSKVRPGSLEIQVLNQLKNLSKTEAKEAMRMLDQSVRSSNIRNLSAYLSSMIRRMGKTSHPPAHAPRGTLQDIEPQARELIQDLIDARLVRQADLDGKALSILSEKPRDVQVLIMQLFSDRNLQNVRNMPAYFMAHMREVDSGLRTGKYRLGRHHEERRHPERRENTSRHDEYDKPHYDYVPTSQRQTFAPPAQHTQESALQSLLAPTHVMPAQETPAKHYALEQVQWGVRVDEFQALSPHAKYVHAAAALRLQQLWDLEQNKLVSVLDDNSWLLLAGLDAPNGVKVVNEVSERMKIAGDDLVTVNKIFVEVASKYPRREDAPPLPASMSYQPQALTASLLNSVQGTTYTNPVFDPRGSTYSKPRVNLPGPAGSLSQQVQSKIDEILGNPSWIGQVTLDNFDDRLVGMLRRDEDKAYQVLDEFNRAEPSKVRNPSAYLVGCVRNAFSNPRSGPERGPRGRGRFGSGGRGRGQAQRYNPY